MKNIKNQFLSFFSRESINSLNVYLFLGFNLTLVSILGFIWFSSASKV
tara:strand:+ start:6004 stop:6147 length:144 start_codon:yes stop_codon:yes gene_type:complete